jgi:hypothetical protein
LIIKEEQTTGITPKDRKVINRVKAFASKVKEGINISVKFQSTVEYSEKFSLITEANKVYFDDDGDVGKFKVSEKVEKELSKKIEAAKKTSPERKALQKEFDSILKDIDDDTWDRLDIESILS